MDELDNKAPRQFPPKPRLLLGGISLLPLVLDDGQVVPGMWLKPGGGGATISTNELQQIAEAHKTDLTISYKE